MIPRRLVRQGSGEVLGSVVRVSQGAVLVRFRTGREALISNRRLSKGLLDFTFRVYESDLDVVRDAIRYARRRPRNAAEAVYYKKALLNILEELRERGVTLP